MSKFDSLIKNKKQETGFKVLTEVEKAHLRPEELLGTIEPITKSFNILDKGSDEFVPKNFEFSEAFFRLFEEAITNSVDEYERNKKIKHINVNVGNDYIEIFDDGSGYPLHKHLFQGKEKYAPEWILTKLNSGTNFDDKDRQTIGMNGVGISLVNFFSTNFEIETSNGKIKYYQEFSNHSKNCSVPKIREIKEKHYTRIKFSPDFGLFKLIIDRKLALDYYMPLYKEYIRNLSIIYPDIKFSLNGEKIFITKKKFISSILDDGVIVSHTNDCDIAIGFSKCTVNNFQMINSKPILEYVNFSIFLQEVYSKAREVLNKKLKLNVSRNAWFKESISVVAFFRGTNVKFKNQTKDILVKFDNPNFNFSDIDSDFWAKKIYTNSEVIENYSKYYNIKNDDIAEKIIKKKIEFIPKLVEATSKIAEEKIILLTEGESASGQLDFVRNPKIHSLFPMMGKPSNVFKESFANIVKNDKYAPIISAINLGDKDNLRHGKCYIVSDSDEDGAHIRLLLIQFFVKYFPWFIDEGRLYVLEAPKYSYKLNNKILYSIEEPLKEAKDIKYFKGLGSMNKEATKEMLFNPNLIHIINSESINKFYKEIYGII